MRSVEGHKRAMLARNLLGQAVMIIASIIMVAPILWMLSTALKEPSAVLSSQPRWIPDPPTLENFTGLFTKSEEFPVLRWLANSVMISCTVTALVLFVTSTAAYAFARLQFRGREVLFMIVVATMIIPGQVTLIPVFLIVQKLGWFNTYPGLVIPGLAGAFGVFLLRQFFMTIPVEIEEAAHVDGAGPFIVYSRVILPVAKPALATLAIFTFIGSWNEFVWPLIITNDISMRTLPVGLMIFQGRYSLEYGTVMAAAVLCGLPMVLAFLIFQKRITEGIALTGIKG